MATKRKTPEQTNPDTVTIDVPEMDSPMPDTEPSMEDFAKAAVASKTTRSASRATKVDREIEHIRTELTRNVSMVVLAIHMRDVWTGQLILLNQDMVIDSWLQVAKVNPAFRGALLKMMDVGVYAAAISNTAALIVGILAHKDMLPNSDMIMSAVSHTGLKMPNDDEVAAMETMFHQFTAPDDPSQNGADGS